MIGVILRTKEFTYSNRSLDMGDVNIDRTLMIESLKILLNEAYSNGVIYRATGVTFMGLTSFTPKQLSLFDIPDKVHVHNEQISNALSKLKTRFGENIISQ